MAQLQQLLQPTPLARAPVGRNLHIDRIGKALAKLLKPLASRTALAEQLVETAFPASRQNHHIVGLNLLPVKQSPLLMVTAGQPAQVSVAFPILGQEKKRIGLLLGVLGMSRVIPKRGRTPTALQARAKRTAPERSADRRGPARAGPVGPPAGPMSRRPERRTNCAR